MASDHTTERIIVPRAMLGRLIDIAWNSGNTGMYVQYHRQQGWDIAWSNETESCTIPASQASFFFLKYS